MVASTLLGELWEIYATLVFSQYFIMYLGDQFALIVGLCMVSSSVYKCIPYYLNSVTKDRSVLSI